MGHHRYGTDYFNAWWDFGDCPNRGVDDMRHETRNEAQDRRADQQFAETTALPADGVPVDADNRIVRPNGAALAPDAACSRCGDQLGGCLWCRPVKLTVDEADLVDHMRRFGAGKHEALRAINPCLDHPTAGCAHVDHSMCAMAKGLTVLHDDPCPWVTFTYNDPSNRVLIHLDRHHDSRAAQRAAADRNCHWGRVIRQLDNGDYIVERMGGPKPPG